QDAVNTESSLRFQDGPRRGFRRFKVRRQGLVVPGIVHLAAAIGDKGELHAKLFRRSIEGTRLVAELCGKKQEAFWWSHQSAISDLIDNSVLTTMQPGQVVSQFECSPSAKTTGSRCYAMEN